MLPALREAPKFGRSLAQCYSRRWYSPIRSRITTPPPALRRMRRANPAAATAALTGYNGQLPSALVTLLNEPILIVERQIELMNVFLSYEQARRFTLYRPDGSTAGYMEEVDLSFTRAIARQFTRLHRPFTVEVYDASGQHAMTIRRPFSFINSHIRCLLPGSLGSSESEQDPSSTIGESVQEWHLWRRRYNLFLHDINNHQDMTQFGRIDAPFLSFSFPVANEEGKLIGSVDRNWVGLMREMFTDTGVYVLRQTSAALRGQEQIYGAELADTSLTLPERAVMLGTAVSIDFDYFSRHSSRGGVIDEP